MTMSLGMAAIGFMAGILAGLFGVGGGLVIVPALVLLYGFSPFAANGTSLVALLLPVGILGALQYYQQGKIGPFEIRSGLLIAFGLFIGAYFGAKIALLMSASVLRRLFSVFMILVAIRLWFLK